MNKTLRIEAALKTAALTVSSAPLADIFKEELVDYL